MSDEKSGPSKKLLIKAEEVAAAEQSFSHPWNPQSRVGFVPLSRLVGLVRTGVSLTRVLPGKESFAYHSHQTEEEWLYILSGRGIAEIDGEEHEVSAGDFMAFPTPSVAHHLRNPFDEDLCYLMGGESRDVEIADFPRLNKRMIRRGGKAEAYPLDQAEEVLFGEDS